MDLGFSDEQILLRRSARAFLADACPPGEVRRQEAAGFSRDLWRQVADLGWLAVRIPEDSGGLGLGLLDLAILCEEAGRALLPGPFVETVVAASVIHDASIVTDLIGGRAIATIAGPAPETITDPATQGTAITARDGRLTGTALYVPFARDVEHIIVAADRLYHVDARDVAIQPIPTMTAQHAGAVILADTPATDLGEADLRVATVLQCAVMVGAAERVLEMTSEYAKGRVAFGKPIGAFQAVQYKIVGMLNDLDAMRWATYEAIWAIDQGDGRGQTALAKYLASHRYRRIAFEAHEVHAGVGFMTDYDLQLYYRHALWCEHRFGNVADHRATLAGALRL